jgi:thiamine monophosphate kinase
VLALFLLILLTSSVNAVRSLYLRHFPKVEKWTRDVTKVDSLLYAGNSLGRARAVFESATKHRPRIKLTIRQQTRVLEQWPRLATPPSSAG